MENEIRKPDIVLKEIYFQRIKFSQIKGARGEIKLKIENKFDFAKSNDNKSVKTSIITTIKEPNARIDIEVVSIGIFDFFNNINIEDTKYSQLMVNIIWPFVRSEISLLTTQPGLSPIMLPIINPRVNPAGKEEIVS